MYHIDYLPLLKLHLRVCKFIKCLPFEYDEKSGLVIRTQNSRQVITFKIQSIFSLLYSFATILHVCIGRLTLTERFLGSLFLILDILLTTTRWNYSLDKSPGQIVNSFLQFEKQILEDLPTAPSSLGTKLMKIFIPVATLSLTGIAIFEFLLLLFAPCTPPFLLSMFPTCRQYYANGYLVQCGIRLFESWMQWHMLLSGGTWVIYILFVGIVCLLTYFRVLHSQIAQIKKDQDMDTCIRLYRSIQILEKSFNDFLMVMIVPAMMICSPGIQLIVQYVCINHHKDIAMPGFLVFPTLGLDAGINNVLVFTLASHINIGSEKALQGMKEKVMGLEKRKLMKRQIRACSVLKVKFGSNFIDRGTPLVIQNFCVNQTVALTLIKSRHVAR
ncbi:hypothetical protein Fcan01_26387 [Folsomia candida]|uniref:Uncharacterized protein n=1 Tax=Folsomia candida TaxID=158441 RepID=A0A226CZL1_FOLCA|nr:hypothetical protein Fcan01_26387 [Folsomia candida]